MADLSDDERVETERKPNGRFEQGKSGNLRGRPAGSRNKASLAAEAMLEGEAERLTRKAIDRALEGDPTALKLCFDRILSPCRERLLQFELPPLNSASDAPKAIAAIIRAVAQGEITLGEATEMEKLVGAFVRATEASDTEERVKMLEDKEFLWEQKPESEPTTPVGNIRHRLEILEAAQGKTRLVMALIRASGLIRHPDLMPDEELVAAHKVVSRLSKIMSSKTIEEIRKLPPLDCLSDFEREWLQYHFEYRRHTVSQDKANELELNTTEKVS